MTMNLFSIFDPSTLYFMNNWVSIFLWLFFFLSFFWLIMNRFNIISLTFIKYIFMEFKPLLLKSNFTLLIIISVFFFILLNNALSLFPYIFCASSHMSFTLSLALLSWLSLMAYGWINNYKNLLIHLIPEGTSSFLMPFMVLVETISNIIRPITLSIRLCANMIAGHLLISLLSNSLINSNLMMFSFMMLGEISLMVLEIAVAFIQAYVFSMLLTLYTSELSS
uniref:ATP synthase subunit a n=1 Tax=Metacrangonyx spinicaudatus TaxID=1199190 RepID=K7ZVR8_9CRUS|nr:ATP synthase F0 subunit 6 [Metacrangonyx spinicaudatus]CCI69424.1 ATP synthase F0 subunit 6 [Metacrangonyx spinicaudatus]